MSPERAARAIQTGLAHHYMVISSSSCPGTISAICPPRCALAEHMERQRPDLVVGVYDRSVTAGEIIEDLQAVQGDRRERNAYTLAPQRAGRR